MKIKKLTLNNFMAFENAEMNWSDNITLSAVRKQYWKNNAFKSNVFIDKAT